jgi:hypothetical protein
VLHQVGAGTLGPVFRAHDPAEGRLVAVKAFKLDLPPGRVAEFAASLNALAGRGLDHASIAAPLAAGVEGTTPWLAQAYVPAESLDAALRQYGPPPLADTLAIVTALASALDVAAVAGVLHGALHPRDVLVAPDDIRLVDLGVAAALESVGLRAPVRRPYTAPERIAGGPVSRAADVFSLGAMAFELVTGHRVAGSGDEAVAALPEIAGANREALVDTFAFVLSAAPDERFTTALGFVAVLKRALGDAPLRAAAPQTGRTADRPVPASVVPAAAAAVAPVAPAAAAPNVAAEGSAAAPPEASPVPEPPAAPARPRVRSPRPKSAVARPDRHAEPPPPVAVPETSDADEDARPVPAVGLDDIEFRPAPPPADSDWGAHDEPSIQPAEASPPAPPPLVPAVPRRSFRVASLPILTATFVVGTCVGLGLGWAVFGRGAAAPAPAPGRATAADVAASGGSATPSVPATPRERLTAAPKTDESAPAQMSGPSAPAPRAQPAGRQSAAVSSPKPPPAAAPARPRAAPAPALGQLVVRSNPSDARVEINGRVRGRTPLTLRDLPLGALTVRVTREGFGPQQRRVTLTASKASQSLDVPLARAAEPARAAPAARATAFVGSVFVETRPAGARVFLDGREVGTSPVDVPGVAAGSHAVRLELPGYKRWSASVTVVAGERNRVAASLEEEGVR